MISRPLLHVGDNLSRCVFSIVRFKPKIHLFQEYTQIRNFQHEKKLSGVLSKNFHKSQNGQHFKIWKSLTFVTMFSGTTFIAATIWEYESIRERTHRMIRMYRPWAQHKPGWRHEMEIWWNSISEGKKIFFPICFLNVMVFLAWNVPVFRTVMNRYFCNNPASSACWPLLLSTFSHYSAIHLLVNMAVLYSFSTIAVQNLGKEQFVALYLTSGVVSSFASSLYKVVLNTTTPSLGASGAIMGILGYTLTEYPDLQLCIIFLPMLKFTANMALKVMIGIDTLGCFLRWKTFDHAAHLGGVLFGMFWHAWGSAAVWQKRDRVLTFWHQIRGKSYYR